MVVEIKNLVKRYNDFLAVDNLNISIKEGEIFGLLGPNGAGKTTTVNAMLGLTKKDSGEIRIFDMDFEKNEKDIKRNIGIVPQDIAIIDGLTAYENVEYFARLFGIKGSKLRERVDEALEFTGLADKKKEYPSKYSGGMKRRLNIACAIAHHPKLIIMDEPTVGIDPQSRNHILESVKELNRMGSTIVYISHYMEEIEQLCTRIAIIDHGKVIASGTNDELKSLIAFEDIISLKLSSVNYTMVDNIKHIYGVNECIVEGDNMKIISQKNSKNLNRIIEIINNTESEIISINVERPTLERVFLTLTGRNLRD